MDNFSDYCLYDYNEVIDFNCSKKVSDMIDVDH